MSSFLEDINPFSDVSPGGEDDPFFGGAAAAASREAGGLQAEASREALQAEIEGRAQAQEFFTPFAGAAERGVEQSQFLADPQAQFEFLQNNPLFQLSLENANRGTNQRAAAAGRSSFGTTLQDLSNNVLLSAQPLLDRQRQDVTNLLQFGGDIAASQANIATGGAARIGDITTDIGANLAAGLVGSANAQAAGGQNLLTTGLTALSFFSDEQLKTNKQLIGQYKGHNLWSWDWNWIARVVLGLRGSAMGVMAREVMKINKDAVILDSSGFYKVKYGDL